MRVILRCFLRNFKTTTKTRGRFDMLSVYPMVAAKWLRYVRSIVQALAASWSTKNHRTSIAFGHIIFLVAIKAITGARLEDSVIAPTAPLILDSRNREPGLY